MHRLLPVLKNMEHTLIDFYRAIEESSAKMLQAAQEKDWDGVARYEGTCAVLIEQLRFNSQEHELLPEHKHEKTRIMQRILRNDAQIRCLAEPWLALCPGAVASNLMPGARSVLGFDPARSASVASAA